MNRAGATRLFGGAMVLASGGFIAYLLWSQWASLAELQFDAELVCSIMAAALVYALACLPLAGAWRLLVNTFSEGKLSATDGRRIFARSQLAKYLPGNVMHIAGRHVLARAAGASHQALVAATLLEIAGLLSVALLLSAPGLLAYEAASRYWDNAYLAVAAGLLVIGALSAPWLYRRLAARLGLADLPVNGKLMGRLAAVALRYGGFFLLASVSLGLIVLSLSTPMGWDSAPLLLFVFCFSWAVGFLTPGAPSGIGVREAVIVLLLGGISGAAQAAMIALLLRLTTVLGDLGFFALDSLLARFGAGRSSADAG